MLTLQHGANKYFKTSKPLEMSPEEEEKFEQSTVCWLCENPLGGTESTEQSCPSVQRASGDSGEKIGTMITKQEKTEEQLIIYLI